MTKLIVAFRNITGDPKKNAYFFEVSESRIST